MPSALRIILTAEEDRTQKELSCADQVPLRTKLRPIALRLNAHGWNVPQIAEYLDWAQQTVRQTIKRWQFQGLGGLWEAPGRGKKLEQQSLLERVRYSSKLGNTENMWCMNGKKKPSPKSDII